jgi:hypothetical protein
MNHSRSADGKCNNLKELLSEKANIEMQIKALNSTIKERNGH